MGPGTPEEAPLQPKAGVSPEPRAGSPEPAQLSCFRGHGHKVGRSRVWCLSSGCSVNQQTLLSTLTRTLSLPGSCGCPRSSLSTKGRGWELSSPLSGNGEGQSSLPCPCHPWERSWFCSGSRAW